MKVTSTILSVLAFTASTFADAEPSPKIRKGLCGYPGMTCHKTKRAAEAVADALALAEPKIKSRKGLCGYPGMTCHKARSPLSAIEDALTTTVDTVYARDADASAEAKAKGRKGLCGYPGMTCAKARSANAEAEPYYKGLCGYRGITCGKMKRGLDLVLEDDPKVFADECFAEGGECHTVLAANEAFHEAIKREADAEAEPKKKYPKGPKYWSPKQNPRIKSYFSRCGYPGSTCARDTHDFVAAATKGEVDAEAAEAECNAADGDCTVVQRSLDELEDALATAVADVYKLI